MAPWINPFIFGRHRTEEKIMRINWSFHHD